MRREVCLLLAVSISVVKANFPASECRVEATADEAGAFGMTLAAPTVAAALNRPTPMQPAVDCQGRSIGTSS
ncbi:hypothetical protein WJX73_002764 [Symbiochloris irregularis]|uniref:Uncharacterized protein n=1 Tax=Symbiochloris irregularis TaxID=706552 RepID=A0AAW1PZ72_9CHLO